MRAGPGLSILARTEPRQWWTRGYSGASWAGRCPADERGAIGGDEVWQQGSQGGSEGSDAKFCQPAAAGATWQMIDGPEAALGVELSNARVDLGARGPQDADVCDHFSFVLPEVVVDGDPQAVTGIVETTIDVVRSGKSRLRQEPENLPPESADRFLRRLPLAHPVIVRQTGRHRQTRERHGMSKPVPECPDTGVMCHRRLIYAIEE